MLWCSHQRECKSSTCACCTKWIRHIRSWCKKCGSLDSIVGDAFHNMWSRTWTWKCRRKSATVRRALCVGKAAGRDFREHLRPWMLCLNSKFCSADPDIWIWPAIKSYGNEHFECVLLCAGDALVASENTMIMTYFMRRRISCIRKFQVCPNRQMRKEFWVEAGVYRTSDVSLW